MFLANENFPFPSIKILREAGHFVRSISLSKPGITDHEVLKIAKEESLIILTLDKDYGEIVFRNNMSFPPAVIFFRSKGADPQEAGRTLAAFLRSQKYSFIDSFTVIEKNNIRQRKYADH